MAGIGALNDPAAREWRLKPDRDHIFGMQVEVLDILADPLLLEHR